MKLYRSLGRIWSGTQADAKTAQGGADYEAIEVPTDKPSLIEWLNKFDVRPGEASKDQMLVGHPDEPETAEAPAPAPPEPPMRETQMARFEALARKLGWTPPGGAVAVPEASTRDLSAEILELDPKKLAPVLSAAIGRLGEVADNHGWAVFGKNVYSWTAGSKSVEQGLGMLFLAALDQIGDKSQRSDQSTA
ncbi:hypothetical protein [Sphingomonas sp. ACRSK]|uniref:hypothetical protein n=1 Tax=Sphingomonas sp. ACRSK TaxID=2918213 RepID=UPI001EF4D25A|nr:hypothetical protein [Sphingomonas sp. ACRSK]MCG7348862.1 hypothetical protein [Sphingomonas sp. ACRSK]